MCHHSRLFCPWQTTDARVWGHSLHSSYPTNLAPGQISMSCGAFGWTLLEPRGISFTTDTNNSLGSPALHKWVQSKFVASAHLFQWGPRTQRLSAQVSSSTQQFQPCDYHRFVGLSLSILCEEREKEGQRPSKAEELVLALQQVVSKFSGSGDK